jgi:ABC-type glucose/galactose transport system permease subunit
MRKRDRVKLLAIGFVGGAVFFSGLSYAATAVGIDVYFRPVQYIFDGVKKLPAEGSQGFI